MQARRPTLVAITSRYTTWLELEAGSARWEMRMCVARAASTARGDCSLVLGWRGHNSKARIGMFITRRAPCPVGVEGIGRRPLRIEAGTVRHTT